MIDFDEVGQAALASAESVVRHLLPDGRRSSGEWFARNPQRSDRSVGSFSVSLRSGAWHDRASGDRGRDLISLWAFVHACGQGEAAGELAAWLGAPITLSRPTPAPRRPAPPPNQRDGSDTAAAARRLWGEAVDPRGTVVEDYLEGERGLRLPPELAGRVIRYHPKLWLKEREAAYPGMLAAYRPVRGDLQDETPVAVQRWFFGPDGRALRGADKRRIKLALGPVRDAAIKLSDDSAVEQGLIVCEGFESGLNAYRHGLRPVWALGSAGAIQRFGPLGGVGSLTILADRDANDAGLIAARACSAAWRAAGATVEVRLAPAVGTDAADYSPEGA